MVERPQLKITDHSVDNDDPFAELTRIMGFDPRVSTPKPVAVPQPAVVRAPAPEPLDLSDDFSLDLERELMGEFGLDPEPAAAPVLRVVEPASAATPRNWFSPAPAPEPVVEPSARAYEQAPEPEQPAVEQPAYAHSDRYQSVNFGQHDEDDADAYEPEVSRAPEPVYPVYEETAEPVYEAAEPVRDEQPAYSGEEEYVEDLDAQPAYAGRYEGESGFSAAAPLQEEPRYDERNADVWSAEPGDDEAYSDEAAAAAATAYAPAAPAYDDYAETPAASDYDAEEEADVESAVAASLEEEFHLDTDWSDEPDPVEELVPPPAAETMQARPAVSAEDTLAADFDAAMAEVDMDFSTAARIEPQAMTEPERHEPELSAEPERHEGEAVAYRPAAAASVPSEASSSSDLEDELNALLGNMRAAPAAAAAASAWSEPVAAAPDPRPAASYTYTRSTPVEAQAAVEANADYEEQAYAPYEDDGAADPIGDENPFDEIFADPIEDEEPEAAQPSSRVSAEPTAEEIENDPINSLAAMAARLRAAHQSGWQRSEQRSMPASQPAAAPVAYDEGDADPVPDIDTVDVEEAPVALADDLDLPEVAYDEERGAQSGYDDLDAEFADLLSDIGAKEKASPEPVRAAPAGLDQPATRDSRIDNGSAYGYAAGAAALGAAMATRTGEVRGPAAQGYDMGQAFHADSLPGNQAPSADDDFAYDPALDDEMALPAYAEPQEQPRRRGMLIAAVVGGVAVVGALGAFALSFGDGGSSGVPVIVRADETPVKVKPDNPGGVTVPNQDNKVYDTVAGGSTVVEPGQEKLVTTTEEPVEIAPPAPEPDELAADADLPVNSDTENDPEMSADGEASGIVAADPVETAPVDTAAPKGEDRIEQVLADAEASEPADVAAVAPRKVRTMVVKPDGSLVPREEPTPVASAEPAAGEEASSLQPVDGTDTAAVDDPMVSVAAPEPAAPEGAAPASTEATTTGAVAPAEPAIATGSTGATPASAPIAPARPAEQPVDIVGEVKPDQVAAVSSTAAAAGSWSVQIASQPTEASAQETYRDLSRRYAGVLGDRQANIVKAEIAGKGTFWRVRIPAGSRNEAVSLCNSYKSAGGNCFVSR